MWYVVDVDLTRLLMSSKPTSAHCCVHLENCHDSADTIIPFVQTPCGCSESSLVKMQIPYALTNGANRAPRISTTSTVRVGGLLVHPAGARLGLSGMWKETRTAGHLRPLDGATRSCS